MAGQRNVLVMVAMEEEAQYLKPYLQNPTEVTLRGIPYAVLRGTIKGVQVDIVVSGIGAVYAASATSAALLQTTPDCVLSVGCSGAHQPGQGVGDVVLGSEVVPLDPVVVERAGASRLSGVRCSMTEKATMSWACDEALTKVALEAARRVLGPGPKIEVGRIGSSDAWRQSPDLITKIATAHGTLCEEMEAHAVAQVCHTFGIPFIAIKDIANSELEPTGVQLEPEHHVVPDEVQVGLNAAKVAAETIQALSAAA